MDKAGQGSLDYKARRIHLEIKFHSYQEDGSHIYSDINDKDAVVKATYHSPHGKVSKPC
jgi:hypothetical protein